MSPKNSTALSNVKSLVSGIRASTSYTPLATFASSSFWLGHNMYTCLPLFAGRSLSFFAAVKNFAILHNGFSSVAGKTAIWALEFKNDAK